MTAIEFHVNVPDKLHYTCRLLRKAYRSGTKAVVTAEADLLIQLDQMIWSFAAVEFLPHCTRISPSQTVKASPIQLIEQLQGCSAEGVLINLGQDPPLHFERFQRFIEIASDLPSDIAAARSRWTHYKARGYSLKKHELSTNVEST